MDKRELDVLADDVVNIIHTISSLPARVFNGNVSRYVRAIGHPEAAAKAIGAGSLGRIEPYGRADALRSAEGFKVVELNTSSAVGGYWISQAGSSLMHRGDFGAFASRNTVDFTDSIEMLVRRLRRLASSVVGTSSPLVALVEEDESGFRAHGAASNLKDYGVTVEHVELKDISSREDGKILIHQETPIDLVLRYFLARDVQRTPDGLDKLNMLINGHQRGKTAFFTPLDSDIVEPKSALALLYEPTVWQILSADEQDAIQRRIPVTRMIQTGHFGDAFGIEPDSLAAVKDEWVLKPFNGNGGEGVVLGSETTTEEWHEHLHRMRNMPYVAQQRVWSLPEELIDPENGQREQWRVHYGIFYSQEGYQGGIAGGAPVTESAIMAPGASVFRRACIFSCG